MTYVKARLTVQEYLEQNLDSSSPSMTHTSFKTLSYKDKHALASKSGFTQ